MQTLDPIKEDFLENAVNQNVSADHIQNVVATLGNDGTWPDIDYEDQSRATWKTFPHLGRVRSLAIAWKRKDSPFYDDNSIREAALRALDHWLGNDYRDPNWWWNKIGVPSTMADILLLLEKTLSDEQMRQGLAIVERAPLESTGQNLIWFALINARRGVLENDVNLVESAFKRISDEIRITDEEGIQTDYSFHQHGACLYNHGYGARFLVDCSKIARLLQDTDFAFSREKIDILVGYLLEGSRWMSYKQWLDFGASGRGITRNNTQSNRYLAEAADNMLQLSTDREDELEAVKSNVEAGETLVTGNRHFWRSDFMAHHRPEYYVSIRMYSERTANTDMPCNHEGLKNHHMADGTTFIVRHGDEYQNLVPVWDWQKIPGTTVLQKHELEDSPRREGTNFFVGGVSDGEYGFASFRFFHEQDDLRAFKSWFCFDQSVVCLGAGVASSANHPVLTTVNQCKLNGTVSADTDGVTRELPKGTHTLANTSWVHHDGIGYVFPAPTQIQLTNQTATGTWWDINRQYSKEQVSEEVFNLWIDHGASPDDSGYAYVLLPNMKASAVAEKAHALPIEILNNTKHLQAVQHTSRNILQAVLYEAGRVQPVNMPQIGVDEPALLMLTVDNDNAAKLCVSDPTQQLSTLHVRLNGHFGTKNAEWQAKNGTTHLTVNLPQGAEAGSTRIIKLHKPST